MITKQQFTKNPESFLQGETILINKPLNWTSFDVVNKIRFLLRDKLKIKKIKVGHAGTLDPLATGLIIVCTGKATKQISEYQNLPKEYITSFRFGATTPSYDLESEINETFSFEHITPELLERTIQEKFIGKIEQVPPVFSAKRIDGKRSYEYARKGIDKKLMPREVEIFSFKTLKNNLPEILFSIQCGSGTYIRSLARDLGRDLSCGAYVSSLKRVKINNFLLVDSLEITTFANLIKQL